MKFFFRHYHNIDPMSLLNSFQDARMRNQVKEYGGHNGGIITHVTICIVENKNREEIDRGYSFCSSKDNFNKSIGRNIAAGRTYYYDEYIRKEKQLKNKHKEKKQ